VRRESRPAAAASPGFCGSLNLKPAARCTDIHRMFSADSTPPPGARVLPRAVRLSLNTPVVAIADLPVGPASAAVVLHEGPRGAHPTLAVRSLRTGRVVFFRPEDDRADEHGPDWVLDAALSFAESMGFLFDDGPSDPAEAARLWTAFLADAALPEPEEDGAEQQPPAARLTKFRMRAALRRRASARPAPAAPARDLWTDLLSRF
jgi:hypothetical protein